MTNIVPNVTEPPQPVLPLMVATIKGAQEVPVKAPQAGYLVAQAYHDGATVAPGDTLFLLDPRLAHADETPGVPSHASLVDVIATAGGVPGRALHGDGDHVDTGDELTDIAEIDNVIAELTVPPGLARDFQKYLNPRAASDQPAFELILPDGSSYPSHGVLANLTTNGDVNTMEIYFPNPTHVLQPGEFVKVRSAAP